MEKGGVYCQAILNDPSLYCLRACYLEFLLFRILLPQYTKHQLGLWGISKGMDSFAKPFNALWYCEKSWTSVDLMGDEEI